MPWPFTDSESDEENELRMKQLVQLVDLVEQLKSREPDCRVKVHRYPLGLNVSKNIPLTRICQIPEDGRYLLNFSAVTKTVDAGAGNAALTVTCQPISASPATYTANLDLTSLATIAPCDGIWLNLAAGTMVSFTFGTASPWGSAVADVLGSVAKF